MQKDMRTKEQNIFKLQEYIDQRTRETDFQSQKEDCGLIIDELTMIHIETARNQQISGPIVSPRSFLSSHSFYLLF